MTKKKSIADARKNLPQLIRDAEAGEAIELTRHGERVAVILSTGEYDRLASHKPNFWDAYQDFKRRHDLEKLDIDPDEILAGIRDTDSGRDPVL
jgi:prevent-host-death family protein